MSDFRVQGQLGLDGQGFFSTLGKARGAVSSFAGSLAGAFSVGAVVAFSKSILDLAGHLNDVSEALSVNVEFLQKFLNSARTSGGDLGDIEKFMFSATQARQAALNKPGGAEAKAFASLGVSSGEISSATTQQLLEKIIASMASGATDEKLNALTAVGGKSAKKLVGGFVKGLDEATQIMTDAVIVQLDVVGDKFTTLATTLKTVLAPAIIWVLNELNNIAKGKDRVGDMTRKVAANMKSGMGFSAALGVAMGQTKAEKEAADKKDAVEMAARLAARHKDEGDPSGLKADKKAPDAAKAGSLYSDSRLAIGGFLGAGMTDSLKSIAENHLQVSREHLVVAKQLVSLVGAKGNTLIIGL